MTSGGAAGETADQLTEAMRSTLPQAQLHPAWNALDLELAKRTHDGLELSIVNAIWGQEDHPFLDPYLDLLAVNYGAGIYLANFDDRPDSERARINRWVSASTGDAIPELLPEGSITGDTRLVLTNAVYLEAAWQTVFEWTHEQGDFELASGEVVQAPMMGTVGSFGLARGDGWTAVELPLDGGELSLTAVMPDSSGYADFESSLTTEQLQTVSATLEPTTLELSFPRFEIASTVDATAAVQALGAVDAFISRTADFSNMDGSRELYLAQVAHQATLKVDEEGLVASAASGVVVITDSAVEPSEVVHVDRPFFFTIRDVPTGAILFCGRVMDPR